MQQAGVGHVAVQNYVVAMPAMNATVDNTEAQATTQQDQTKLYNGVDRVLIYN